MKTISLNQNPENFNNYHQFATQNNHQNRENFSLLKPKLVLPIQSFDLYPLKITKDPSTNWFYHIRNCILQKKPNEALLIYTRNRGNGNLILGALPLVLKACASLSMLNLGKALHGEAIKGGVEVDVMVGTGLVDMYGKCGDVMDSRRMFDFMPERNVVTWNAMVGGYMRNGDTKSASLLFEKMSIQTSVTWNEMIGGYAKNGDLIMARQFFDRVPEEMRNVVTWTVMVDGYASNGDMEGAVEVFEAMRERNFYVWSSMISGYFKKGDVKKAKTTFDRMECRNLVNWNSLISGYAQNGFCEKALDEFRRMQLEGFEPDGVTLVSVLSACTQLGLLDVGKEINEMIIQKGIELNQYVLNALVDMYAKCGDLDHARLIFEGMEDKNYASWNALISGFATHGQCEDALNFFYRMESAGEKPDDITFLSVLSACAHGGLVEEGLDTFSKIEKYGSTASIKHYGCLVDLLGRAGRLQEAYDLVKGMPMRPNDTVLGALLGACRIHNDTAMADHVLQEVDKLNCKSVLYNGEYRVLLSNIYAASERWEKAEGMRVVLSNKGSQKAPGCSAVIS